MFHQRGENFFAQGFEGAGVAKEAGDMDEDVAIKLVNLLGVALDQYVDSLAGFPRG